MSSVAAESARMLDILIPNGGDLVTVAEAFFDESYDDRRPRVICVAGCVFRKSRSIEFTKEWSRYLRRKELPYFHANECAHGIGIFEGRDDTDQVSRELIRLTKKYADLSVAVALDQDAYAEICSGHPMFPSAYTYALTNCLYGIAHWRVAVQRTSPTAFYFEQGHKHATDASQFLNFMLGGDDLKARIGYRSHAFVPKETPQVQPGDLLAWLWRLHCGRVITNNPRPMRKDLEALQRPHDYFVYFDRQRLQNFRESIARHSAQAEAMVRSAALLSGIPRDLAEKAARWVPDYRKPGEI